MSEVTSLRRHLIDELRDLLDAEQQITRALPQFVNAAATPALKQAFQKHLKETDRQLDRLNQALSSLGETPRAKRCVGMRGLIAEGNAMVSGTPKGALRDAILISGAQKVEHYEMASYGTARTYAEVLGRADVARLLDDTLQEEKAADRTLTEIAEQTVNTRAAEEWHKQSAGILDSSSEWVGQTVGAAARTVRRAANVIGLGNIDAEQAVETMRQTANSATDTLSDAAQAVVKKGRRFSGETVRSARAVAAEIIPDTGSRRGARKAKGAGNAGRARRAGRKK
jgi:ferritin-like metal-binding protein YciE